MIPEFSGGNSFPDHGRALKGRDLIKRKKKKKKRGPFTDLVREFLTSSIIVTWLTQNRVSPKIPE